MKLLHHSYSTNGVIRFSRYNGVKLMKCVVALFYCALLINPVLSVYGMIVRWFVIRFDVANRCFYGIVGNPPFVIGFAVSTSVAIIILVSRLTRHLSLVKQKCVLVSLAAILLLLQMPRHSVSPIFGYDGDDARGKVHLGRVRLLPFAEQNLVFKTDPCSFVLVLITRIHAPRPYEVFNFSDIGGFVYNRNDLHSVRIQFRDAARERLILCLDKYEYEHVDVYVCGERRLSLPVDLDSLCRLKFPCHGNEITSLQYGRLGTLHDNVYDAHDLSRIRRKFNDAKSGR